MVVIGGESAPEPADRVTATVDAEVDEVEPEVEPHEEVEEQEEVEEFILPVAPLAVEVAFASNENAPDDYSDIDSG